MTRGELDASRTRRASGGQGRAVAVAAGPAGAGRPGPRHAHRGAVPIRAGGAVASLVQRLKRQLKWLCLGTEGTRGRRGGGASQRPLRHRRPRGPARPASLAAPRVPCAKCRVRTRPLRKRGFHGAQLRGSRSPPTTAALRWAFLAPRDGTEGDEDPRSDIIRGQLWGKMRREAVARAEPRVGAGSDGFKGTPGA